MISSRPAWLLLASGDQRYRGGPYDDSPTEHYSWDSRVARSEHPRPGDAVVLSNGTALLGASVIDAITTGSAEKAIHSCPACGSGRIKPRKETLPVYRCTKCKGTFDEPTTKVETVTTYRAVYSSGT